MALLTLVRHGQASFLQDNYDKLSALGEQQARILGEYWVRAGAVFDQVYYGPACRHLETGEIVGDVFRKAGIHWPKPVTLPELDEYAGIQVMRTFLPGLMETHEDIRALEAEFRQTVDQNDAFRVYDRLFQRIVGMWVEEQLDAPEVESWKRFRERVSSGIESIRSRTAKNGRIAVFTSGGVIGASVGEALDLAPQKTLEVSWTSRNASLRNSCSPGDAFRSAVLTITRIWSSRSC